MKKIIVVLTLGSLLTLAGCGGSGTPTSSVSAPVGASSGTIIASSSALKQFEGLLFQSQSVVYDGAKHSLAVEKSPEGAILSYSGQDYVNAGVYPITATIVKEGYATKTMEATLTINEADLTAEKVTSLGLSFTDASYPYDAESHSVQLMGDVPAGTTVIYKIGDQEGNSAIEVGEYSVSCILKMPNYHSYTLTAKLSIVAVEKTLYSTVIGTTVLFQNDLDSDSLYAYSSSLKKVSYDIIGGFSNTGNVSFGIVKSLYGTAVCTYQNDGQGGIKKTKVLAGVGIDKIAAVDSTHFYYSVHNLLVNKQDNGIYLYDTANNGDDYRGSKIISDDFAYDMAVEGGVLYYIDQNRELASYASGSKTLFHTGDKLYELAANNGVIYYNKGSVAAKGLYKLQISNKSESKLSLDNGRDLSIIGNALYYVNQDVLTTGLFGKGIYRVPLDGSFAALSGTLIVDGTNDKIGSLSTDGTSLFYYRFNTSHFYKNATSGADEADLMASFVKAEDTTLIGGAATAYDNGQVYFANLKDDGCLYKYDVKTKSVFKVLPFSVNNVFVHDGFLYFGSYVLTNYAEWRMDLQSKVITKISGDRCESLRFIGNKIYYVNVGGTKATLHSMGLDGTNDSEIVSDGIDPFSLEVVDSKAYVVRDPAVGYKKLATIDLAGRAITVSDSKCLALVLGESKKLYLYNGADKALASYDITAAKTASLLSGLSELSDFSFVNGKLYAQDITATKLVVYDGGALKPLAAVSPSGIIGDGTILYFVAAKTSMVNNYPTTAYDKATSNGSLYSYSTSLSLLYNV